MYTYKAVCTRVIDGDTVELLINLGFNITHKIRGRLLDVNAPEIFSGTQKEAGQLVKEHLESQVLNKSVYVTTFKDKMSFNRWIVKITDLDGNNINEEISNFIKGYLYESSTK